MQTKFKSILAFVYSPIDISLCEMDGMAQWQRLMKIKWLLDMLHIYRRFLPNSDS